METRICYRTMAFLPSPRPRRRVPLSEHRATLKKGAPLNPTTATNSDEPRVALRPSPSEPSWGNPRRDIELHAGVLHGHPLLVTSPECAREQSGDACL